MKRGLLMIALALAVASTAAAETAVLTPAEESYYNGVYYGRGIQLQQEAAGEHYGNFYATCEYYQSGAEHFPIYESQDGETFHHISDVFDTENNAKKYRQAADGTWQTVPEGTEGATTYRNERWRMLYQPCLYEMPETVGELQAGSVLCAGLAVGNEHSRIDVYVSRDGLRTWDYSSNVTEGGKAEMGVGSAIWEPFMIVENGTLYCFFSDERGMTEGGGQRLVYSKTSDGVTWSAPVDVCDLEAENATYRPGMPIVTKLPDGRFFLVYEGVNMGSPHPTYYLVTDDIETWNASERGTLMPAPFDGGSPYTAVLRDGTLVVGACGTDLIAVCDDLATNSWIAHETALPGAYSRALFPTLDGRLFVTGAGTPWAERPHRLVCGFAEVGASEKLLPQRVFGSEPWSDIATAAGANGAENAVDGQLDTFFDGYPDGEVVMDLGSVRSVGAIAYGPRAGFGERMRGGVFSVSNDLETWRVLYTVPTAPSGTVLRYVPARAWETQTPFRYLKYTANGENYCNIAEFAAYAGDLAFVSDGASIVEQGTQAYLPVRAVFEALGYTVVWEENPQTVILQTEDAQLRLPLGDGAGGVMLLGDRCLISTEKLTALGCTVTIGDDRVTVTRP